MISVLIVDDEKLICDLINVSISWNELGMEVVGIANNGVEAMDFLQQNKVDIVITDIRMPGMDGIGLIKTAREQGMDCKFIIISGYQDFEYAQNAIKYCVTNYIVKPVDEDELTVTLYKIAEEINKNETQDQYETAIETKLEETSSKLKEQFVRMIVKQGYVEDAFATINPKKHLDFKAPYFQCVVFRVDENRNTLCDYGLIQMLLEKISETVNKEMKKSSIDFVFFKDECYLIYVFNFNDETDLAKKLKNLFVDLKILVNSYRQYILTMGIGSSVQDMEHINYSYTQADLAVKYRIITGENKIIESSKLDFEKTNASEYLSPIQKRKLINLLELCDIEGIEQWIDSIYTFKDTQKINPILLFDLAKNIFMIIKDTFFEIGYELKEETYDSLFSRLESAGSIESFTKILKEHIRNEVLMFQEERKEEFSRPVEATKEFISKNYEKDITLTDVAKAVYLNPNYLSSLFKKETQMTFIDYLQTYRIHIATDLLKDLSIKQSEIPEKIGYKDVKYFAKIFKRVMGLSPSEYRKLYT